MLFAGFVTILSIYSIDINWYLYSVSHSNAYTRILCMATQFRFDVVVFR